MIVSNNYIGVSEPGIIQFENANEGRSYPFADNTVLKSDSGITLNDNVIADLHLSIPKTCNAYLSSVYISDNLVSTCIRIIDINNKISALSCTVERSSFEPYRPYMLEKLTGSEDVGGIVTFGAIDFMSDKGSYRFLNTLIEISDSAISKYTPSKLRKIIDDRTGESLSGALKFEFQSYVLAKKNERWSQA